GGQGKWGIDMGSQEAHPDHDRNASSKRPGLQFSFQSEPVRVSVVLAPNNVERKEPPCNCRQFWKDRRLPAYCKEPSSAFLPQWLSASAGADGHWEAQRSKWP